MNGLARPQQQVITFILMGMANINEKLSSGKTCLNLYSMDDSLRKLILYACPTGDLGTQITQYLEESQRQWGINKAHQYMPHCTLTGFFHDQQQAIASYLQAISTVLENLPVPPNPIQVTEMLFPDKWHGLALESDWLLAIAQAFANAAVSPTRSEAVRLKSWLHVSLAYGFDPDHAQGLKQLAIETVDPNAAVEWELRFYERSPSNEWTCHGRWPCGSM